MVDWWGQPFGSSRKKWLQANKEQRIYKQNIQDTFLVLSLRNDPATIFHLFGWCWCVCPKGIVTWPNEYVTKPLLLWKGQVGIQNVSYCCNYRWLFVGLLCPWIEPYIGLQCVYTYWHEKNYKEIDMVHVWIRPK